MVAAITKTEEGYEVPMVVQGMRSIFLDMERWEFAKKVASMLAASSMVPKQFQGPEGVGNCMIAMNLAERMGVDVFMLMQTLYVVHGRPGLEGKLVIALVNGAGRFEPLEFEQQGEGKTKKGIPRPEQVRAFAKELKSKKVLYGPWVSWAMAEAEGWTADKGTGQTVQTSKWQTLPELMFRYRSAAFFARTFCPEVLMGLRAKEELEESPPIDITPSRPQLPQAEAGKVTYEIKTSKPAEKPPEAPKTPTEPPNQELQQTSPPDEGQGKATDTETDVVDEATKAFVIEAEKCGEILYGTEAGKADWKKITKHYKVDSKPLRDLAPELREPFLKQCKLRIDKLNEVK